jgi:hypothetical protein
VICNLLTGFLKSKMCSKFNAILANENILLIDPVEEELFEHPVIPVSAFPAAPQQTSHTAYEIFPTRWREVKAQIIQQANPPLELRQVRPGTPPQLSPTSRLGDRSDAQILAQLQAFEPLPGESDAASRKRLNAIFEGVHPATMDRLMGHASRLEQQSKINAATSFMRSQQMIAEASAAAFRTTDSGNMMPWRWVQERK